MSESISPLHYTADSIAPLTQCVRPIVASLDWSGGSHVGHSVQFYEDDDFLLSSLLRTLSTAFRSGETCIVIATADHLGQLQALANDSDVDLQVAAAVGQYIPLDAAETLATFMVNGSPDWQAFETMLGGVLAAAARRQAPIRAYGEMVALLWQQGKHAAALRLERFWNELANAYHFTLHCAYPLRDFNQHAHSNLFVAITGEHDRALPTESYVTRNLSDPGLRHISILQQKAAALQYETAERIKAQQALQASLTRQQHLSEINAAMDEFISIASHQLRTPATAVKQYLGILLEGYDGPLTESQREKLKRAYDINERQLKTLADLLLVAKVDAGKVHLLTEDCNVADLLQEIIAEHADAARQRSQPITLKAPPDIMVRADQRYLRMAIDNLIDNARKYSPEGQPIAVTAGKSKGQVFIQVRDKGIGISKQDQGKLWQKFARIENEQSAHITGTGLGLYWAQKIITLQGGHMALTSPGPRLGSTFTIYLPTT
jgi:signal transduction histidine kinase